MLHYRYLLIGGGMAADSAVRGIRDVDNVGTIGLLSTEADPPYDRPPLSKSIWLDHEASELDRGTASLDVSLHLGRRALSLDREERTVTDDAGQVYRFDRLLLATGGSPRRLPGRDDGVIYYRTLADYRRLNALCSKPTRVLVVGGGYIGAELGAALCLAGHEVHMAFPEATILERLLPPELGEHVNGLYRDNGVTLHPGRLVSNVQAEPGGGSLVRFENGSELQAGAVVAGLGILPETALAEAAGLRHRDHHVGEDRPGHRRLDDRMLDAEKVLDPPVGPHGWLLPAIAAQNRPLGAGRQGPGMKRTMTAAAGRLRTPQIGDAGAHVEGETQETGPAHRRPPMPPCPVPARGQLDNPRHLAMLAR